MHLIDPLRDPRWTQFVDTHPAACAFHSAAWMQALSSTYGYQPAAITSSPPDDALTDAIPFCRVESWATGRRLVSLPFTDHCEPLGFTGESRTAVTEFLTELAAKERYKYIELRPACVPVGDEKHRSAQYATHWLDLTAPIETIFKSLDKDSIQRKVRRADREQLEYADGRSPEMIDSFYRLLIRTRRRHQLPPQPKTWFYKLAEIMGDSVQFRIASKDGTAIAAIVTLTHRNSIIYKYGCSDERYHATGSMPFLFWRSIEEAKTAGIPLMDFGRSDLDNPGLIRFKDQWGTRRTELTYYRFPAPTAEGGSSGLIRRAAKTIFARLPDRLLELVGTKIYRHMG